VIMDCGYADAICSRIPRIREFGSGPVRYCAISVNVVVVATEGRK